MPERDVAKTSGAVSVLVTSTVVYGVNLSRVEQTVVNDGANDIYLQLQTVLGTAPTAVAHQGILLKSGGGSWSSDVYQGALAAIALTGTTVLTVVEI